MSPRFRRVIAAGQIIGGLGSACSPAIVGAQGGAMSMTRTSAALVLGAAAVIAGRLLWKGDPEGLRWSFWIQLLQILQVRTPEWAFSMGAGFGAGATFMPNEMRFQLQIFMGPDGVMEAGWRVGFNLLSLYLALVFWRDSHPEPSAGHLPADGEAVAGALR